MAHGQMPERELERVMRDFVAQRTNLLLCSTIIETGIDVPTANTIVMSRADKFGLAQLHQLRGRVGRSHHQAYAYLMVPDTEGLTKQAAQRLDAIQAMEELGSGFYLAMHDLEIRGAGEVLGENQSGNMLEIGFQLYNEMLSEAVRCLKAGIEPDLLSPLSVTTDINLHAPALLPNDYCGDVHLRLSFYKKLATAKTPEQIDDLLEEIVDRFGKLPAQAQTLIDVHRLRVLSQPYGVVKVDAAPGVIHITLQAEPADRLHAHHRTDPEKPAHQAGRQRETAHRARTARAQGPRADGARRAALAGAAPARRPGQLIRPGGFPGAGLASRSRCRRAAPVRITINHPQPLSPNLREAKTMHTRRTALTAIGALYAMATGSPASAQAAFPDRPVKIIVALPAGGSVDMIARMLGQKLAAAMGQPFVVDNRAGGSGQIGMPAVAKAPPDGYTLTVSPASFLTTNKSIFKALPYDPETDFAPISKLVNQPMVLVVRDRQKFPTLAAFLSAAKATPGKLTFASSGDGSPQHLAGLMFETRTKTELLHVPYKGGALAINDILGGNVDAMFAVLPEALPHLRSGKLHALGLMSPQRSPVLANVPTMAEAGVADLTLSAWIGLLAPAKTPRPIIDQLNRAVRAAMDADFKAKLAESGIEVAPGTPEELQRTISADIKLHAELVKAAGLTPQ